MDLLNITIGEHLTNIARKYPNEIALIQGSTGQSLTWRELDALTDRHAKGFLQNGLKKHDKLVLWSNNTISLVVSCLAAMKIGVIAVPISIHMKEQEFKNCLLLSDATALCFADGHRDVDYSEIAQQIWADESFCRAFLVPSLRLLINLESKKTASSIPLGEIAASGAKYPEEAYRTTRDAIQPEDPASIIFTSGSTAIPKAVLLSHKSLVNNSYFSMQRLGMQQSDRLCLAVPLFHSFGISTGLLGCIASGSAMVLLEAYRASEVLKFVEKYLCTALHGVPTMFSRLLEHKDFERYDLSRLKKGILAGSSCAPSLVSDIVNRMGMSGICISYGQTETSPCCTQTEPDDSIKVKSCSVGKPIPCVEMKVIDTLTGQEKRPGEIGELCTRGYHVMLGYYRAAHATELTIDKNGWLHTGDVGFVDADGRYHFVNRLKEIIIRGGENISPQEIECAVLEHPSVKAAKVYGVPSAGLGEEVAASVVLRDGFNLDNSELCGFLAQRLAHYKLLKFLDIRDSLPLTASGKIDVCELRNCMICKLDGGETPDSGRATVPGKI